MTQIQYKKDFEKMFELIKKNQNCILKLNIENGYAQNEKQKLYESFELSCGAFFQIFEFNVLFSYDENLQPKGHRKSWDFLQEISKLDELSDKILKHNNNLKIVSKNMGIANAAVRISSATLLVCEIIDEINNKKKLKIGWPFQKYYNSFRNDWCRQKCGYKHEPEGHLYDILKTFEQFNKSGEKKELSDEQYLLLIVALRDEFGHCEFGGKLGNKYNKHLNDTYREKRAPILENNFHKYIELAIINILKKILETINKLCHELKS